jgi:hypothetical protein
MGPSLVVNCPLVIEDTVDGRQSAGRVRDNCYDAEQESAKDWRFENTVILEFARSRRASWAVSPMFD